MIRRTDITVLDAAGTPEPGVYITVKNDVGALATLYDDAAGLMANPFQSGLGGAFAYNVADGDAGAYTEEYRLNLSASPRTIKAVLLTTGVGGIDDLIADTAPTANIVTRSVQKIGLLISAAVASLSRYATSRTTLASVAGLAGVPCYLAEPGREGWFVFDGSNNVANVTSDPNQVKYVAPASDPTGASGAWVRKAAVLTPFMAGAKDDGSDARAALQAFNDFFFAAKRSEYADWTGNFAVNCGANVLSIGPTAQPALNTANYNVGGDLFLTQLAPGFETVRLKNLFQTQWQGRISNKGIGSTSFASRQPGTGNGVAFYLDNCATMKSGGLRGYNFWYSGIMSPVNGNDVANWGILNFRDCGSGTSVTTQSFRSNWSAPVNSGGQSSTTQLSTVTLDVMPDASLETYLSVGSQTIHVRVDGDPLGLLYQVKSWDLVAKTISVFPWLDQSLITAGSGALTWCWGAGVFTKGADNGVQTIEHIDAIRCGRGLCVTSLYGMRLEKANIASCGTAVIIGADSASSQIGFSADALYTEGCTEQIVLCGPTTGSAYFYINSGYEIDLSKCWSLGSTTRKNDNSLNMAQFGASGTGPIGTIASRGRLYFWHKAPIGVTPSASFIDHKFPPRTVSRRLDSETVLLTVQGTGEFNRLFGYSGSTWVYIGSGTNGAPTGNIVFTPPAGGTVNGGAVNATATFSGFYAATAFQIDHTSVDQLTWSVRPLFGWKSSVASGLAAIAASGSANDLIAGTVPAARMPALTGDATSAGGTVALTIAPSAVTLAKMADMATASLIYRKTAGSGPPEVNGLATLKTDLGLAGANSGDQTITLTGDVTGSGAGSFAATIASGAVTLAKQANMASASVVYRKTAGSGAPEVQSLATLKTDLAITAGDVSGLAYFATGTDAANLTGTVSVDRLPVDALGGDASLRISGLLIDTCAQSGSTTLAGVANREQLYPWVPSRDLTISAIGIEVTTGVGSTNVKCLAYDSDPSTGASKNLLKETGNLSSASTSTTPVTEAWSYTFKKGTKYWMGTRHSSTASLRAYASANTLSIGRTTGGPQSNSLTRTRTFATAAEDPYVTSTANLATTNLYAVTLVEA